MPTMDETTRTAVPDGSALPPAGRARPPALSGYDRPGLFFLLALTVPWVMWILAGVVSHRPDRSPALETATAVLGVLGLLAPTVVAAAFVLPRACLRHDVTRRLGFVRGAPTWTPVAAVALLPGALLAATAVSVLLGGPSDQFLPQRGVSFTAGLIPAWFVLGGAAVLEELAWHSYGTDALVRRRRLLSATLLFSLYWALWHAPLSGIRGYYQAEVVEAGWTATLTFVVSIPAFMILMNWVYYRSGRSILVAVLFHLSANVGNELLRTEPGTKLIQTLILLVLCVAVVWHDRDLFLCAPAPRRRSAALRAESPPP